MEWGATRSISRFREVSTGQFDIALDLRVDEDTPPLLNHVDAALRCGIGSRSRHPYLNIALPNEFETREVVSVEAETVVLNPNALRSRMPMQTPFFHETDFSVTDMHLIYGPYIRLPLGKLQAEFGFQLSAPIIRSKSQVEIVVEVVQAELQETVGFKRVHKVLNVPQTVLEVEFENDDPTARYEFRVYVGGHPRRTRLRFFGVRVKVIERGLSRRRYLPAELHIGEQLSLLVQLVTERVRTLYAPDLLENIAGSQQTAALAEIPTSTNCIVIAPVSNSTVRDWPIERYIRLIGMLMARLECRIMLVGSRSQASDLNHICEQLGSDPRVINLAGRTGWSELAATLRRADLVIANNSGVTHLASACGRPTLAIYSGSHQPQEWGPRGESARVLTAAVSCSPCGYERLELCPHGHLCMTLIEPEAVLEQALKMLARGHSSKRGAPGNRIACPGLARSSGQ